MAQYIDKAAVVAEVERRIAKYKKILVSIDKKGDDWVDSMSMLNAKIDVLQHILSYIDTLEAKEVDLKQKSFVKIDRKLLFEICDAILNHYGYSDVNDCPENDSECFWGKWDEGFRKKVENIRRNS